jgi:hypothetical protein
MVAVAVAEQIEEELVAEVLGLGVLSMIGPAFSLGLRSGEVSW